MKYGLYKSIKKGYKHQQFECTNINIQDKGLFVRNGIQACD